MVWTEEFLQDPRVKRVFLGEVPDGRARACDGDA
jgi:hypothetical protein